MPALLPVIGAVVAASLPTIAAKIAGAIAVSYLSQKISESEQRSALRKLRARGERFNIRSAVEPLPVIYGRVNRLPGLIVFQKGHGTIPGDYWQQTNTFNNDTRLLTTVVAWSEGQISGYGNRWINDIDSDDERFDQLTYLRNFIGTDTQTADAELVAQSAAENNAETIGGMWTENHRLRGVAYTVFTCSYSPGSYGADGIPTFTADVLGKVCYDPRNGQTYWTRTPALHILDYLLNTRYGAAIPAAEIDFASFASAASYCEERDLTLENRTQRYLCDAIIDPSDNWFDAVSDLLAACRGWLVYSGGTYKLILDRPTPVTFDLNEDNLTGAWSIQMDSLGERVNRVTAEFIDDAEQSKPNSVTVDDPAYRITDGNELLERTISLPGVTSDGQARDLATMELRASRYSLVVEVNAILEAMRCEVGDVVSLTHSVPGWDAKPFRVERIALQSTDEVRLTLREYSDTVYSDQTENADVPPGTTLADPTVMPQIAVLLTTPRKSGEPGSEVFDIHARWNYNEAYFARWFEFQWIADSTSFPGGSAWVNPANEVFETTVQASETSYNPTTTQRSFAISGLKPSTQYAIRARARSSIGGTGPWSLNFIETTLDPSPLPIPSGGIVADPNLTIQNAWYVYSGKSEWLPTGGPLGKAAIRLTQTSPSSAALFRAAERVGEDWGISPAGNTFNVWITFRIVSAGVSQLACRLFVYSSTPDRSPIGYMSNYAAVNLSGYSLNTWHTAGPLAIAASADPIASGTTAPHRVQVEVYIGGAAAVVDVSNVQVLEAS